MVKKAFLGKIGLWSSYFISLTKGEGFLAEKSGMFQGRNKFTYCSCWNCKVLLEESVRWGLVGKKG